MQPNTPPQQPNRSPEAVRSDTIASNLEAQAKNLPEELASTQPGLAEKQPVISTSSSASLASANKPQGVVSSSAQSQKDAVAQTPPSLSATDDGVIEKEWVDRAEDIIKTKADDPYREEEDEEALSREYLKQRFKIDVSDS